MKRYISSILFIGALMLASSCTDEVISPEPEVPQEGYVDPDMPEELRNGFTVSFNMSLDQFGGQAATRVTNSQLQDIDNFVDLEKVRILFFVCAREENGESVPDTANSPGTHYHTGVNDHFLFESKSRWVSMLSDAESTTAKWQVTSPVFTYGNNDEYRWEDVRWALTHLPFKVAVLVNRPDVVDFGNFDSKFNTDTLKVNTGRGPNWGPEDSWIPPERRTRPEDASKNWNDMHTINDLHHCQWDVVYSSKNSGDKNTFAMPGVYSFIMKNPTPEKRNPVPRPNFADPKDEVHETNMMGALSNWTTKDDLGAGSENCYFHPTRTAGIPMYGVQVFNPIKDWKEGTPYNISDRHVDQSGQYVRKNINLLRSLVKLELKIPRMMKNKDGEEEEISINKPYLRFSNVMARCEPLDVATPTERLWHDEDWNASTYCEWKNLLDYGPIINDGADKEVSLDYFHKRMAWFYGAWRDWWDFNSDRADGLDPGSPYFNSFGKESPRIFNPVIQRNDKARIDKCIVEDPDFYYYVIYTGERNINDPSYFGTTTAYDASAAHIAYFQFDVESSAGTKTFLVSLTDYKKNSYIKKDYKSSSGATELTTYKGNMAKSTNPDDYNWPLLRNHTYTFTVNSLGDFSDTGSGIDVTVVSSESRVAPGIWFY